MTNEGSGVLIGAVDLCELVMAQDGQTLADIMIAPVIAAEADDLQEDAVENFSKHRLRMIPVVDAEDYLLGVIRYNDLMKGLGARP